MNRIPSLKELLSENDCWDGNLIGTGTHSSGIVTPGTATFNSPDISQHPENFYPVGQNKVDTYNSNKATGPDPKDVKKLKKKVTPDEILVGVDYEMRRMTNRNKSRALAIVVQNLKKDSEYYSSLHMLGVDGEDEQLNENSMKDFDDGERYHFPPLIKAPISFLQLREFPTKEDLWRALTNTRTLRRQLQHNSDNRVQNLGVKDTPLVVKKLQSYEKIIMDVMEKAGLLRNGLETESFCNDHQTDRNSCACKNPEETKETPIDKIVRTDESSKKSSKKSVKNIGPCIGDCRDEELVDDIFGSVSEFARQVEEYGNEFEYRGVTIRYNPKTDIHRFYTLNELRGKSGNPIDEIIKPAREEDVDPKELEIGIKAEMEHTNDKEESKKIALTHLAENPHYYSKLKKVGLEEMTPSGIIGNKCSKCNKPMENGQTVCEKCKIGEPNKPIQENVNIPETKRILDAMVEYRKNLRVDVDKKVINAFKETIDNRKSGRSKLYDDKFNISDRLKRDIL